MSVYTNRELALVILFIVGYAGIAFEEKIKINKTAIALLLAAGCWSLNLIYKWHDQDIMFQLNSHLADTAQIMFFLIGAMSIVEIIDSYQGFYYIKRLIHAKNNRSLIWVIVMATFILSSFLDNVTTVIIMMNFMHKVVFDKDTRLIFASMIIISANAGGAWSPIGDVTTTMLWIKGCVSSWPLIKSVFSPSLISVLVPLVYFTFVLKSDFSIVSNQEDMVDSKSKSVFFIGIITLLFVPVLKGTFGLPPYLSVLLGLGILWVYTDLVHKKGEEQSVPRILRKIDFSTILFLFGILLAVAALEACGILNKAAFFLDTLIPNQLLAISFIGIVSSIFDNVPLTAAIMGMYDLVSYPMNSYLWKMIAYCVGTGGSLLVIGSAAGVVVMGIEKLSFLWYLKNISFIVLLGYAIGMTMFIVM